MQKDNFFFENLLGKDFVVHHIVTKEDNIYAFFFTKEYIESHYDERYRLIGTGPLIYNCTTGTHKILGSLEFIQEHFDANIFPIFEEEKSYNKIISEVSKRKRINSEDFEYLIPFFGSDYSEVSISTYDECFFEVKFCKEKHLDNWLSFLNQVNMKYERLNSNTIKLNNGNILED